MSVFVQQSEIVCHENGTKYYEVNFRSYSARLLSEDEYKEMEAMIDKWIGDLKTNEIKES